MYDYLQNVKTNIFFITYKKDVKIGDTPIGLTLPCRYGSKFLRQTLSVNVSCCFAEMPVICGFFEIII